MDFQKDIRVRYYINTYFLRYFPSLQFANHLCWDTMIIGTKIQTLPGYTKIDGPPNINLPHYRTSYSPPTNRVARWSSDFVTRYPYSIFLKARPHLYGNAIKACETEANANECQKVACSAFAAQTNELAFRWLFVTCPNECMSTRVWWRTYFSLKYDSRWKAFACSPNIYTA